MKPRSSARRASPRPRTRRGSGAPPCPRGCRRLSGGVTRRLPSSAAEGGAGASWIRLTPAALLDDQGQRRPRLPDPRHAEAGGWPDAAQPTELEHNGATGRRAERPRRRRGRLGVIHQRDCSEPRGRMHAIAIPRPTPPAAGRVPMQHRSRSSGIGSLCSAQSWCRSGLSEKPLGGGEQVPASHGDRPQV